MAALGSGQFTGSQPVAIRPLSVGMVTEASESELKPGAVFRAEGFDAVEKGLRRLGGFSLANTVPLKPVFENEVQTDFFVVKTPDRGDYPTVLTNKALYYFNPGYEPVPICWKKEFPVESSSVSGGKTVLVLDETETGISTGDAVSGSPEIKVSLVEEIDGKTEVTLDGISDISTLKVIKPFRGERVSWCLGRGFAWLVDGSSGKVFRFDGQWLDSVPVVESSGNQSVTMLDATWVIIFKERLYFGSPTELDGIHRVRVRWSEVLGWGQGPFIESPSENYQDLGGSGEITGMIGLEDLLIAFTTNKIFYGKETSIGVLPYAFVQIQAGDVSVVGPKAFGGLLGSVVFVGPDDIYAIGLDQGYPTLSQIGTPIANLVYPLTDPASSAVCPDTENSRVLIGVSGGTKKVIDRVFLWNYRSKGWTVFRTENIRGIAATDFIDDLRVEDVPPEWTFENSPVSGESSLALLGQYRGNRIMFLDGYGYSYLYDRNTGVNQFVNGNRSIKTVLETQDYDFNEPDILKTIYEVRPRIRDADGPVLVRLSGSTDCGKTWKQLGSRSFTDSAELDFRLTGYTIRFRLEFESSGKPWTLLELTLRAKVRGVGQ